MYSIVMNYTNKKGFSHLAHFSKTGKYICPAKTEQPMIFVKKTYKNKTGREHKAYYTPEGKYIEPVEVESEVVYKRMTYKKSLEETMIEQMNKVTLKRVDSFNSDDSYEDSSDEEILLKKSCV